VQSLTYLNVSGCKALKAIPVLSNLIWLYCSNCPGLTAIPVLPNLTMLYCFDCPGLTAVPVLPNLTKLYCSNCRCLTSQPNAPAYIHNTGCPWLEPLLSHNLPRVLCLQRWARNRKAQRFVRLTTSRAFNEHFFAPSQKGGRWHKRRMERDFEFNHKRIRL